MLKHIDEMAKFDDAMEEFRRKCINCGHTIYLTKRTPNKLCRWCGVMNYYDKKDEFRETIKKALKK